MDEKAELICSLYYVVQPLYLCQNLLFKVRKAYQHGGGHISSTVLSDFLLVLEYTMYIFAICTLSPLYVSVGI